MCPCARVLVWRLEVSLKCAVDLISGTWGLIKTTFLSPSSFPPQLAMATDYISEEKKYL